MFNYLKAKRLELLERQIDQKKYSGMSPEELAECRELFSQFDKEKRGFLKWYNFKGVLNALGEEMPYVLIKC